MKILLLNDNPVVRKLVALSAQKTKDDLSVVWSVDEIEGSQYDLLIVDDAHYSDEAMDMLKQKIQYKTSLLMATRGNATPAGFDKVINKPFLPTDLVDLFSKISQGLSSPTPNISEEKSKPIILDDAVEEESDKDINLDDFDIEDDEMPVKTNVLDREEVQELQDLLDDTDHFDIEDELSLDGLMEDDMTVDLDHTASNDNLLESLDDDILETLEVGNSVKGIEDGLQNKMEEFDFDEEILGLEVGDLKPEAEILDDEDLLGSLDDLLEMDEPQEESEEITSDTKEEEMDDLEALLLEDFGEYEETLPEEMTDDVLGDDMLSDNEFGELEQQIQEAVEELGVEDLEQSFDEIEMGDFEGLGDFDSLSERDIKLAIGEEMEEELEASVGGDNYASLDEGDLDEIIGESEVIELDDELEDIDTDVSTEIKPATQHRGTPAEGVDALQALLKALANDEVAKTLKGLSINININFGNEK